MPNARDAYVTQTSPNSAPTLATGDVTPAVFNRWESMCKRFFATKKVPEDEKVSRVIYHLENPAMIEWINVEEEELLGMTFATFCTTFKKKWFPKSWEDTIRARMISMQGRRSFFDWQYAVRADNLLLVGTEDHIKEGDLRKFLFDRLNIELRAAYKRNDKKDEISDITDLNAWVEEVRTLDDELAEEDRRTKNLWLSHMKDEPRVTTRSGPSSSKATTSASTTPTVSRPPKITDEERRLINENNGCLKCRKLYTDHWAKKCPYDAPSGENYAPITIATAAAAKLAYNALQAKANGVSVNAVFGNTNSDDDDNMNEDSTQSSSVYDEDSGDSESLDAYVLEPNPSNLLPPLWWDCRIDGPVTDVPIIVKALIDTGCPTVLISPELAECLHLEVKPLHKPLTVNAAYSTGGKRGSRISLDRFVKLSVCSKDYAFQSKSLYAILCPGLHADLILGTSFIGHNNIVIDVGLHTAILRGTTHDLLHPPDPKLARKNPAAVKSPRALRREWVVAGKILKDQTRLALQQRFLRDDIKEKVDSVCEPAEGIPIIAYVRTRIVELAEQDRLAKLDAKMKAKHKDRFPTDIPHTSELPNDVHHRIVVSDAKKIRVSRAYTCPRKFRESWRILIEQHEKAGRIRPSSSEYASPSFIIPKADKAVLPRWVNDYRLLNAVTVPDNYPLPRIDDILADCAKGKIWGKIDMTNSFFQTRMHPDDIKYTATLTPFGLWEWVVMPMGLRNAPATHQRRVMLALKKYIGKICHVYLDDIIIWSNSIAEHEINCSLILSALADAHLYCSLKKTNLFCTEIDFLGHHISARGIEADSAKVERIVNWPVPSKAKDVRMFLGLVRYIASFLPALAEHTAILTPLTTKACNVNFPSWDEKHQRAFQAIKDLVLSRECLTRIEHDDPGENRIFVTCDASKRRTGAVLSFGLTWESARPVAYDSMQFTGAQLNYPVHEQEMLAIIRSLKKWRVDLLGSHITIVTDHRTLENFDTQKDLSRRQARWMEFLSQYDYTIVYVPGETNTVADALSRTDVEDTLPPSINVNALFSIGTDPSVLRDIKTGYMSDSFCKNLFADIASGKIDKKSGVRVTDGLLYLGNRLVIPRASSLRETLFHMAHDALGHFGGEKSYIALRNDYYWPNMRRDLVDAYVASCPDCQRNKGRTAKPSGPLHPLPIPDGRLECITMDFVGPLPEENDVDCLLTITDRLGADVQIIPCRIDSTAQQIAGLFFDHWYCENGCPLEIISDRDKLFVSKFWTALMARAGIKHRLSTSYHPQTDGLSERSNKTVIQAIRFHVERNQKGWSNALPAVRFHIMNTVNASTGFSGFQLKTGRSPRLLPPLVDGIIPTSLDDSIAVDLLKKLEIDVLEAKDNLIAAKIDQAHHANKSRAVEHVYKVGDRVLLSTINRRREYMQKQDGRVAKFMPRFDGPYTILDFHPDTSNYLLDLPNSPNIHPNFHASQLEPFVENDSTKFPHRELSRPGPIITPDGETEYFIERILDERPRGKGRQFLVRWTGYGPEHDLWLAGRELEDTIALDTWEAQKVSDI